MSSEEKYRLFDDPLGYHQHGEGDHCPVAQAAEVHWRLAAAVSPELPGAEGNLKQDNRIEQNSRRVVIPGSGEISMSQRDEAAGHAAAGAVHAGETPKGAE